jgi:hypothetical protein
MTARVRNPSLTGPGALEHRDLEPHHDSWRVPRGGVAGDEGSPLYLQRVTAPVGRES